MDELQIEYVDIKSIKPYKKNARKHSKESVDVIANSIQEFGMADPIAVWKNTIVEGHGRLLACKKLGLEKVPIVRLDYMTDEQRKAYTLAHNKTQEFSSWDFDLLPNELEHIFDVDMSKFGFELTKEEFGLEPEQEQEEEEDEIDEGYYGDERERTNKEYNLEYNDLERTEGYYQMPIIKACNHIPKDLIGFNYVLSSDRYDCGVHFFVDDYQFYRCWQIHTNMVRS